MIGEKAAARRIRWGVIGWALALIGWIAVEGNVAFTALMAVGAAVLLGAQLGRRLFAGRRPGFGLWLAGMAGLGLLTGVSANLLTLGLMAVKTGLHAHGPEFTPDEIAWVLGQLTPWVVAGGLLGGAAGLALWRPWSPSEPE